MIFGRTAFSSAGSITIQLDTRAFLPGLTIGCITYKVQVLDTILTSAILDFTLLVIDIKRQIHGDLDMRSGRTSSRIVFTSPGITSRFSMIIDLDSVAEFVMAYISDSLIAQAMTISQWVVPGRWLNISICIPQPATMKKPGALCQECQLVFILAINARSRRR